MSTLRAPSSSAEIVAFVVFAAIAVVGALATVMAKNPIRSAVGLFFHVLALAGLYLALSAHFLAVIQLIVYAGAVVVLFVFVIMLLGPAADTPRDRRGLGARITGAVLVAISAGMVLSHLRYVQRPLVRRLEEYGTLWQIGNDLFGRAAIPFELVSVLLVVAMVGAIAISRGSRKAAEAREARQRAGEGRLVAPLDPRLSTRDARILAEDNDPDAARPAHAEEHHS